MGYSVSVQFRAGAERTWPLSMFETSEPYIATVSGFAFITDSREVLVEGTDMQ